jgi:hypothetical protein
MLETMHPTETGDGHQERGSRTNGAARRMRVGLLLTVLFTVLLTSSTACATVPQGTPTSAGAARQALVWMTTADGTSTLAQRPAATFLSGYLPRADAMVSVKTRTRYQRLREVGAAAPKCADEVGEPNFITTNFITRGRASRGRADHRPDHSLRRGHRR